MSETLGAYDNKYLIRNKGILKTTINGNAKEHKEMHKNKCSDHAPNRGKGWLSEAQCMQVYVCGKRKQKALLKCKMNLLFIAACIHT